MKSAKSMFMTVALAVVFLLPLSAQAQPGPPGGQAVNVVNPIPLPVTGDVNATVIGRGEPFHETVPVGFSAGEHNLGESFSIGDGNRLEVEYLNLNRTAHTAGGALSEKVSVRLSTLSYSGTAVEAGFTTSDFGWSSAIRGEKVLLHIKPGGNVAVFVSRDTASDFEGFNISVVGRLFPVEPE